MVLVITACGDQSRHKGNRGKQSGVGLGPEGLGGGCVCGGGGGSGGGCLIH